MVQIKFTKFGANSLFGGFAPGDTLRCSPEMAKHLVEETQVAEYVVKAVAPAAPATIDAPKKRAKKD